MIVSNKIHSKAFKGKLECAVKELRKSLSEGVLNARQKLLLYSRMNEYKALYEEGMPQQSTENSSNNSTENFWARKSNNTPVRASSERLIAMQSVIDELNEEIQRLRSESKKQRVEDCCADTEEKDKAIEEYERANASLTLELNAERTIRQNVELELRNEIAGLNAKIEHLNCSQREQKREGGSAISFPLVSATNDRVAELNHEILAYREKVFGLQADLATAEKTIRHLTDECQRSSDSFHDLEQRRSIRMADIDTNPAYACDDIQKVLADELKSISEVFDRAMARNKEQEREIVALHRKNQALFNETAVLANKLKNTDDVRVLVEKERRRNEQCRAELSELSRGLESGWAEIEKARRDKDSRAEHYRELLRRSEGSLKQSEEELGNTRAALRAAQEGARRLTDEVVRLDQDNKSKTRIFNTLRKMNDGDWDDQMTNDLEMYRRILRCSLCDTNIKNCTISKCMHCFCADCIQSRFKSRYRKCPVCDGEFSISDVKKIYL